MEQFIENLSEIITCLLSVFSCIVAFYRTRKSKFKFDSNSNLDLSQYVVLIDGREYSLDSLTIKRKEVSSIEDKN